MNDDPKDEIKMQPGRHGGSLQIGNKGNSGGKKGRSGARPEAFRIRMQAILDRSKLAERLENTINDPEASVKDVLAAGEFVADRALGKPTQHIELPTTLPTLVIRRDDSAPDPDAPSE